MRRERLEKLTFDDLIRIAQKERINIPEDIEKEELIEIIIESFLERQEEREFDNVSVQIEGTKYALSQDEELDVTGDDYPLPVNYNKTRIIFITRDPYWAFAYWEIDDNTIKQIKADEGFEGLLLRVHDIKLINFDGTNSNFYFDIPVLLTDDNWYINVPHANSVYLVELLYSCNGEMRFIAKSNIISTPKEEITKVIDDQWTLNTTDDIIELIRKDFASFHPDAIGIPQRIISFVSSSYIPYE